MRIISLVLGLAIVALVAAPAFAQAPPPGADPGSESAGPPKAPAAEKPSKPPKAPEGQPGDPEGKRGRKPGVFGEHSPAMFRDVTDEDVNDILAFTHEFLPQVNAELLKMKDSDPSHFKQMCRRLRFEIRQFRALKSENPEAFSKAIEERQLQARARELGQTFRQSSDPAERERLRKELRGILQKRFDADAFTRRAQIHRLEEALKKVRAELQDREGRRDEVIDRQLEEITSPRADADPFDPAPPLKMDGKRGSKPEGKREGKGEGKRPSGGDD